MVAQGRRADARLLSRGRCAWSSLLDIPPWALQQRSSESPLVYAWGVRMNNQCAAPSSMGNEPIFAELAATTNYSFLRGASHPSDMVGKAMGLGHRSEEHTSELQSLMRSSYAGFCLKKKNIYEH